MSLGHAIVQILTWALSPSTAVAVPQGQPPTIANATHIAPTFLIHMCQ